MSTHHTGTANTDDVESATTPRRPLRRLVGLAVAAAAAVSIVPTAVAASPQQDVSALNWLMDTRTGAVGRGAHTALERFDDTIAIDIHARNLEVGHAYTTWFVIFNEPAGCVGGCGEDDLFRPEANASVVWSGAAGIANGGGNLNVKGRLGEGDPNPQGAQVLFGPGLTETGSTEIHLVVRDHGPASNDATTLHAQLTTFEGNCTPESSFGLGTGDFACVDPQASVHLAPAG